MDGGPAKGGPHPRGPHEDPHLRASKHTWRKIAAGIPCALEGGGLWGKLLVSGKDTLQGGVDLGTEGAKCGRSRGR